MGILNDIPERLSGLAAWLGPQMLDQPDAWMTQLDKANIAELKAAAQHFLSLDRDIGEITADDFPLSRLDPYLTQL